MIGDRIRQMRKKKGFSQAQMAIKLHITQGAISQWENGTTAPSAEQVIALADFFGISADDLLGRDTKKEPATAGGQSVEKYLRLNPENRRKIDELIALYLTAQSDDQPPPADPE